MGRGQRGQGWQGRQGGREVGQRVVVQLRGAKRGPSDTVVLLLDAGALGVRASQHPLCEGRIVA